MDETADEITPSTIAVVVNETPPRTRSRGANDTPSDDSSRSVKDVHSPQLAGERIEFVREIKEQLDALGQREDGIMKDEIDLQEKGDKAISSMATSITLLAMICVFNVVVQNKIYCPYAYVMAGALMTGFLVTVLHIGFMTQRRLNRLSPYMERLERKHNTLLSDIKSLKGQMNQTTVCVIGSIPRRIEMLEAGPKFMYSKGQHIWSVRLMVACAVIYAIVYFAATCHLCVEKNQSSQMPRLSVN